MKRVLGGLLIMVFLAGGYFYVMHRVESSRGIFSDEWSWETCKKRIIEPGMVVISEEEVDIEGLPARTLIAHDATDVVAGVFEGDGYGCQPLVVKNAAWLGDENFDPKFMLVDVSARENMNELLLKVYPFESSIIVYRADDELHATKFIEEYKIFTLLDGQLRKDETYGLASYFSEINEKGVATHAVIICSQGNQACLEGAPGAPRRGVITFTTVWKQGTWEIVGVKRGR